MAVIITKLNKNVFQRAFSTLKPLPQAGVEVPDYIQLSDTWTPEYSETFKNLCRDMRLRNDFLSIEEEKSIYEEIEPYLKKMRYEFDHWDDAIHGFRETERLQWNGINAKILDRVRDFAFPKGVAQLKHVHILDLAPKGYIKPHIDAIRFCGNTIAGLNLLSDSVMRLVHDKHKELYIDVFLKRRSLYIMTDTARFDYTHEIHPDEKSYFKGEKVPRARRISVICRNEPVDNVDD